MYSKFSFWEVYRLIYGRKFSFTMTCMGSCRTDAIPPRMKFEYGYPHSNALLQFPLKLKLCKLRKAAPHPRICGIINNNKLFPTVYHRIYCHKFLMLSNQKSRYKSKYIRISYINYFVKFQEIWEPQHDLLISTFML